MAMPIAAQASSHPLAAYNFRVDVGGVTMRFAKVSGLKVEYRTLTYRDGLSYREGERIARYRVDDWTSITLEQGAVAGSSALAQWLESGEPRPMQVSLCDAQGLPALIWKLAWAVPTKLAVSDLEASTNNAAIDTLEVKASGISLGSR